MRNPGRILTVSLALTWIVLTAAVLVNGFSAQPSEATGHVTETDTRTFLVQTLTAAPGALVRIDAPSFEGQPIDTYILGGGQGDLLATGGTPETIYEHRAPPYPEGPVLVTRAADESGTTIDIVWAITSPPPSSTAGTTPGSLLVSAQDVTFRVYDANLFLGSILLGALAVPAAFIMIAAAFFWIRAGAPTPVRPTRWPHAILGAAAIAFILIVGRGLLTAVTNNPGEIGPTPWWGLNILITYGLATLMTTAYWWRGFRSPDSAVFERTV